jgi:hypothetical protein
MCIGGKKKQKPAPAVAQPSNIALPAQDPAVRETAEMRAKGGAFLSAREMSSFSGRASPFRISLFERVR